jgi:hypothetical protein
MASELSLGVSKRLDIPSCPRQFETTRKHQPATKVRKKRKTEALELSMKIHCPEKTRKNLNYEDEEQEITYDTDGTEEPKFSLNIFSKTVASEQLPQTSSRQTRPQIRHHQRRHFDASPDTTERARSPNALANGSLLRKPSCLSGSGATPEQQQSLSVQK